MSAATLTAECDRNWSCYKNLGFIGVIALFVSGCGSEERMEPEPVRFPDEVEIMAQLLDIEPVALDRLQRVAVAVEQCGRGDNELEFQVRMRGDGMERRPNARVAGARGHDHANTSSAHGCGKPSMSSAMRT